MVRIFHPPPPRAPPQPQTGSLTWGAQPRPDLGRSPGSQSRRGAAGCRHRCGQPVLGSDAAARSQAPCGNCSILLGFWQSGQICSGRKFKCHLIGFILMLHFIFLGNRGPEVTTSNLYVTALLILGLIFCVISLSPLSLTLIDFAILYILVAPTTVVTETKMHGNFLLSSLLLCPVPPPPHPLACHFSLGSLSARECKWTSTVVPAFCHPTVPFFSPLTLHCPECLFCLIRMIPQALLFPQASSGDPSLFYFLRC